MTDSLRDRIAAVAYNAYAGYDTAWDQSEGDILRKDWLEVADAVIAELRLRREDLGGFRVPGYGGHRGYRYVTEWEADE